jgi:hypothetical protein
LTRTRNEIPHFQKCRAAPGFDIQRRHFAGVLTREGEVAADRLPLVAQLALALMGFWPGVVLGSHSDGVL